MARTIRVWWPNASTGWRNFNWTGVINGRSVVHISACEATALPPPNFNTTQDFIASTRKIGDAVIGVRNIHPHDSGGGGVEFYLEVNWGSPLNVVTDISVDEPAEAGTIV
ncbi:MAG: hypothetical protein WBS22_10910 [Methylocystis sp.]